MKKLILLPVVTAIAITFTGLLSCSEKAENVQDESSIVAVLTTDLEEDLVVEEILDEVMLDLEQFEFLKSVSTCPVITIETPEETRFPRIITKDFGEGCTTEWGTEKSGKIIITVYGPWLKAGSKRTVAFEDFTHRGIAIYGKEEIICNGLNDDSLYVHSIKGKLTLVRPDSLIIVRDFQKRRTMLAGVGNPDVPNEWLVEGHIKVNRSDSVHFMVKIDEPLYRIQGCRWYQGGIKAIHYNAAGNADGRYDRKVYFDYGYAESEDRCDSYALRWVDEGEPKVVNLNR
jgi:hypothetical protein